MTNKSFRDYINLIENLQKSVEESTDFAGRPVDQGLVRRQEKYWNQVAKEKKQQELKRSRQLKKPGVTEGSETHKYKVVVKGEKRSYSVWVEAKNEEVAIIRAQQYVAREHNDTAKRAAVVDMKQGVAEEQLEETTPEAIEKVEHLYRK